MRRPFPDSNPLRFKLSTKMFLITFGLVESIILLLGFSYYRYSANTLQHAQTEYAKQMVQKSDQYLQLTLAHIRSFFLSVANDNRLRTGTESEIRHWLNDNLIYFMPNASNIHVIADESTIISTDAGGWKLAESSYLMQQLALVIHPGELYWIGPYFSPVSGYTFSVVMTAADGQGEPRQLMVDLNLQSLYTALIPNGSSQQQGSLLLLDAKNRPIFANPPYANYSVFSKSFRLNDIPESLFASNWKQYELMDDSRQLFLTRSRTNFVGWQVVWIMDLQTLLSPLRKLLDYTGLLIGLSLVLSLGIAMLISVLVSRPIRRIAATMVEVSDGNLDVSIPIKRTDELGLLARHFNLMIGRLRGLIDDLRRTEEERNKADFIALQAQIKPHFLFNTLNTISMVARQGALDKVDELISALTDQLQYSLDSSPAPATLREELRSLESYVELMGARYGDAFSIETDIDPAVLERLLPKFTLQPIVENAIFHGLVPSGRQGTLFIGAADQGEQWELMVEDDGIGMSEARLQLLLDSLGGTRQAERIGMLNVHRRLRLMFGEHYACRIDSSPGNGTRLIMTLPAVRKAGTIPIQEDGR
ncbi:sensor histidine kinase [Paenibacillus hodogayensis]|uniref:Sensor histidine kinase n=1 Tax=Paenibacillus hodogayensis TaxID=279208 RepID=A0ABV5VXH8_9BACL